MLSLLFGVALALPTLQVPRYAFLIGDSSDAACKDLNKQYYPRLPRVPVESVVHEHTLDACHFSCQDTGFRVIGNRRQGPFRFRCKTNYRLHVQTQTSRRIYPLLNGSFRRQIQKAQCHHVDRVVVDLTCTDAVLAEMSRTVGQDWLTLSIAS